MSGKNNDSALLKATVVGLAVLLASCTPSAPQSSTAEATDATTPLPTVSLRITAPGSATRHWQVEVARTQAEQERGLMHRTRLDRDKGMVFPLTPPRTASFWMKDTPLPLDLLFIRPDGTIAAVKRGTPDDLTPLSAGEPVSAVLELAAGGAAGLATDMRVEWGNCPPAAERRTLSPTPDGLAFCPPSP